MNQPRSISQLQWYFIFGALSLILPLAIMLYLYNRFLPVQEGWFQYYVFLMNQKGELPYKDFYLFLQPLWLFFVQWIAKFNSGYIYLRYWGMIERSVLILTLYFLIAREFSPAASFIGVVIATSIFQSVNGDLLYTFYQTALLFFVLILILINERYRSKKASYLYFTGAGILASLAFFTKQSSGLFIIAFLLFILIWDSSIKDFLHRLIYLTTGMVLPAIVIVGWLIQNHIFSDYIHQVFGGTSSKGSIFSILFGFWGHNNAPIFLILWLILAILLFIAIRLKLFKVWVVGHPLNNQKINFIAILVFPVAILLDFILISNGKITSFLILPSILSGYFATYLTFIVIVLASILIGFRWLLKRDLPFTKQIAVIFLGALIWMYSSGISYQIDEACILIGTAVITAYFFDYIQFKTQFPKMIMLAVIFCIVFLASIRKLEIPYSWWGWTEYHHDQNATSIIPAFKGFYLDPNDVKIYDRIYSDIMSNTLPTDTVYTYPHIVLFNFITGRLQPTFSPVHYFDVCPDSCAISDANLLRESPPKMIIFLQMPEWVYEFHEQAFRNGNRSGQREIEATVHELVTKYNYRTIDEFLTPGWGWTLTVYLKP